MIVNVFIKRATLFIFLFFLVATNIYSQQSKSKSEVVVKIAPYNSKARFSRKNPVKYKIQFMNNLRDVQQGSLVYTVFDNSGRQVLDHKFDVMVNAKKLFSSNFEVPIDREGNYTIVMNIELTNFTNTYNGSFTYIGPPKR
ncbi:hypothetical protein [Sediminibacterium sp.]|uniref:hypothetical protein n=1 Tax=Sediminibacterium sp. TaxID=1917865 RepID=UPI003F727FDA